MLNLGCKCWECSLKSENLIIGYFMSVSITGLLLQIDLHFVKLKGWEGKWKLNFHQGISKTGVSNVLDGSSI